MFRYVARLPQGEVWSAGVGSYAGIETGRIAAWRRTADARNQDAVYGTERINLVYEIKRILTTYAIYRIDVM